MNRRGFIGAALACVAGLVGLAGPKPLRKVERWADGQWRVVRMRELKAGDTFRLEQVEGIWRAVCDGRPHPTGTAIVTAEGPVSDLGA